MFPVYQYAEHLNQTQKITLRGKNRTFEYIARIEATGSQLTMVAITPIGQKLFQIIYTTNGVDFTGFGIDEEIKPELILADVGLVHINEETIAECLSRDGQTLKIIAMTDSKRIFETSKGERIIVRYSGASAPANRTIEYDNRIYDYHVTIQMLD